MSFSQKTGTVKLGEYDSSQHRLKTVRFVFVSQNFPGHLPIYFFYEE